MAKMSRLRRRMIEYMTDRNLSPATQRSYIHAVAKFSRHAGGCASTPAPIAPVLILACAMIRPASGSRFRPVSRPVLRRRDTI
jgi:hypothetical protein